MKKTGFDNAKYIKMQSEQIKKRISQFGGKLYLEFGGKLFDDTHAARVLPGFEPDSKLKMLLELKDQAEIVIAVSAGALESSKRRGDLGITYDMEVLRLIDMFRSVGLYVGSVVITQYNGQQAADKLKTQLEAHDVKVFKHYIIDGYPFNVQHIVSAEGYGKNDYIETSRSLVVITAPGPGSGKMATCLSQLYHEHERGINAGYAKFETFPIWNLPLKHPVNLAYEAATADLSDVNMIDPFHLQAYGEATVNYNRDIEIFPVLSTMFGKIYGESPYKSPTDMGVNMAGYCIFDDEAVREAASQEIIFRYYRALTDSIKGGKSTSKKEIETIEMIMDQAGISPYDRRVVRPAVELEAKTGTSCAAIELSDGTIITGKTKNTLGACAAMIINALKHLSGIDDSVELVPGDLLRPVQTLKIKYLGSKNPCLHIDEALIAISVNAATDENAAKALSKLSELRGCHAHSTVIPSSIDLAFMRRLKINLSCEPKYKENKLFNL